jgi:hypothetical protein
VADVGAALLKSLLLLHARLGSSLCLGGVEELEVLVLTQACWRLFIIFQELCQIFSSSHFVIGSLALTSFTSSFGPLRIRGNSFLLPESSDLHKLV